jgi:hypothetical protein
MKLRFLCVNHRVLLENDIKKALQFFQSGLDSGQFYFERAEWSEAMTHLGCAFEVAEIILTKSINEKEASRACDWLTTSTLLLAYSFNNTNYLSEAEDVIWITINRIERQLGHNPTQAVWCSRHLERLYGELASISKDDLTINTSRFTEAEISNPISRMH